MGTGSDDARSSLVPNLAVELAATPGMTHHVIDGSMLSADISGFTALSERLADKGKAGAEEITSLISRCFTALIDTAYDYGGEILKFGGDALLVLFRGDEHELRVAAASVAMQEALTASSAAKQARLTMTVGASEGPFDVFMVGTTTRDLLISGGRASKVIELEGEADKASTLISREIAKALPEDFPRTDHELGYVIDVVVEAPRSGPDVHEHDPDIVASLIAPTIRDQFAAFETSGGEHRIVAVDFLKLDGVQAHLDKHGGQATADALGDLFDAVHDIGDRFDVSILHTDIAPDGVKFLLCAGAPHTTGETSDAILEAALQIQKIETPFVLKQGIQSGRCFAGFLGSEHRRTYTLMGDIVNTAARMLGPANAGDIVAVDDVFTTARTAFITDPLPPVHAKGKTEPIAASLVVSTSDSNRLTRAATPLIGRSTQLAALLDVLESDAGVAELVGPAGAGKSRLLEAIVEVADDQGRNIARGHCSPYSQASPYSALRVLLRNVLGIDSFADAETSGDVLTKMVRHIAPELEPMVPILAIPVGATVSATPESDAIDPKFLRSQINTNVEHLLHAALPGRSIVVLEDVHWIDEPSAEFFDHVLPQNHRNDITTILTRRPSGDWQIATGEQRFESIVVEPLTATDIRDLAIASSVDNLTDRQLDVVVEQSDGNPLFAIELAKAVGSQENVPDTVEQLIAARIDALDPDERHAMRVAAVFGYHLRRESLREVLEPKPLPPLANAREFIATQPNGDMTFTHALYREVAYEGLPYAERRRIHRAVGEHLEASVDDPATLADLLALHFSEAKDSTRSWKYGVVAGDAARRNAATAEAAANYERALRAVGRVAAADSDETVRVALALGDALTLLGRFEESERAYRKARTSATDTKTQLTAMLRVGRMRELQGRQSAATRWYSRVEDLLKDAGDRPELLLVRSEMHHQRSGILHRRGDQQGCIIEARLALGTAEDGNDVEAMAEALHRLHLATIYLGRPDHIGYGTRALELFGQLGRIERQSNVLNNLGIEHYFAGDWDAASDFYRRSAETGAASGSLIDGLLGALNGGEILSDQGHWDEAIELLESARRNWEDGRYPTGLAMSQLYLGIAHSRRGDDKIASDLLADAHASLDGLALHDLSVDARSHIFWHQVQAGGAQRAELETFISSTAAETSRSRALRALGCLAGGEGDWVAVRPMLIDALPSLSGYSRALTLRVLAQYDDSAAVSEWTAEAQAIFDSLGVVRLRPLPDPPA